MNEECYLIAYLRRLEWIVCRELDVQEEHSTRIRRLCNTSMDITGQVPDKAGICTAKDRLYPKSWKIKVCYGHTSLSGTINDIIQCWLILQQISVGNDRSLQCRRLSIMISLWMMSETCLVSLMTDLSWWDHGLLKCIDAHSSLRLLGQRDAWCFGSQNTANSSIMLIRNWASWRYHMWFLVWLTVWCFFEETRMPNYESSLSWIGDLWLDQDPWC